MITKYHKDGFKYYSFQPEAIKFLVDKDKAILALPTGTGKTLVSIGVYACLKEKDEDLKLIFVTDKSVIRQTDKSIAKYMTLKSTYIYGDVKSKRRQIYSDFIDNKDVLILNYAMLRTDVEEFEEIYSKIGGDRLVLIFDEANNLAGLTSKIHLIARNMCESVRNAYFLTATVSKGKLEDYYNLLLCLGINEEDVYTFREEYGNFGIGVRATFQIGNRKIGYSSARKDAKKYTIRFGLKDLKPKGKFVCVNKSSSRNVYNNCIVLDLPKEKWEDREPRYIRTRVEVVDESNKVYLIQVGINSYYTLLGYKNVRKFADKYKGVIYSKSKRWIVDNMEDSELPDFTRMMYYVDEDKETKRAIGRLYKESDMEPNHAQLNIVLCMPHYVEGEKEHINNKIKELLYTIENRIGEDEQAIIYNSSKRVINFVYDVLKDKYSCSRITGDIVKDREEEKMRFINGESKIMLITDAGGVGVDGLQVCNNIIFLGMPTTGGQLAQICGRISRINTTHNKLLLHFIITEKTFDEDKYVAVMSQVRLMSILDENSVDGGLLDEDITVSRTEEESDIFIREKIMSRKSQYI